MSDSTIILYAKITHGGLASDLEKANANIFLFKEYFQRIAKAFNFKRAHFIKCERMENGVNAIKFDCFELKKFDDFETLIKKQPELKKYLSNSGGLNVRIKKTHQKEFLKDLFKMFQADNLEDTFPIFSPFSFYLNQVLPYLCIKKEKLLFHSTVTQRQHIGVKSVDIDALLLKIAVTKETVETVNFRLIRELTASQYLAIKRGE